MSIVFFSFIIFSSADEDILIGDKEKAFNSLLDRCQKMIEREHCDTMPRMLLSVNNISYFAYALVLPSRRQNRILRTLIAFLSPINNVLDKLKKKITRVRNIRLKFFSNLLIVRSPNAAGYRRLVVEHRRPIPLTRDTPDQYETILQ